MTTRRVACTQKTTLILCVVLSLIRCSSGWTTALSGSGEGRHVRPKFSRTSVPYIKKLLLSHSYSWRLSAESSQEGQEVSQSPAVEPTLGDFNTEKEVASSQPNQPWWEPERKTEGKPTLTSSTQWRMFLSLKARVSSTILISCSARTAQLLLFATPLVFGIHFCRRSSCFCAQFILHKTRCRIFQISVSYLGLWPNLWLLPWYAYVRS